MHLLAPSLPLSRASAVYKPFFGNTEIMHLRFCSLLASGLTLFTRLVSSSPIVPHYLRAVDVSKPVSPKQVQNDLGRTLSKGTLIFGPSNPAFAEATERWSTRSMPDDIQVVVEVAQESDVAKVVGRTFYSYG